MRLLAELAPAPLMPGLAVGLWALLGLLVLYGLRYTVVAWLTAVLHIIGRSTSWIPGIGHVTEKLTDGAVHFMQQALASAILRQRLLLGLWFQGMEIAVRYSADTTLQAAGDTYHALRALRDHFIPAHVAASTAGVAGHVADVDARTRARENEIARESQKGIEAGVRDLTAEKLRTQRGIDALQTKILGRIAHAEGVLAQDIAAVRGYAHDVLAHRLTRLEKIVGAGVLAGAVVAALTRVFPYWQCTNVRRLMRGTCRAHRDWLELLFGVGLEAFIVEDLCDFIAAVSAAAKLAEPALLEFVAVENVLIGCHGASRPPSLPIAPLAIPLASSGIALAA